MPTTTRRPRKGCSCSTPRPRSPSATASGSAARVAEFSGLTELTNVTATTICGSGFSVTPTPVTLPVASVDGWERYEGMRIGIAQDLTVTEVFTLARFGEAALSAGGRLANPTNVVAPGGPAQALQALNDRSRILLDDGNGQQNIDPTFYPQGGLSAANTLRVGDALPGLTGVLDQRFGVYRVQPIDAAALEFTHSNPRPAAPAAVGGDVRIAAFNVLNYFNGNGAGRRLPNRARRPHPGGVRPPAGEDHHRDRRARRGRRRADGARERQHRRPSSARSRISSPDSTTPSGPARMTSSTPASSAPTRSASASSTSRRPSRRSATTRSSTRRSIPASSTRRTGRRSPRRSSGWRPGRASPPSSTTSSRRDRTASTSATPTPATGRATATRPGRRRPRRWSTGWRPIRPAATTRTSCCWET